jgi:hypothetical protein
MICRVNSYRVSPIYSNHNNVGKQLRKYPPTCTVAKDVRRQALSVDLAKCDRHVSITSYAEHRNQVMANAQETGAFGPIKKHHDIKRPNSRFNYGSFA